MRFSNGKRHRETRQSCAFFQHVSGMSGTECGQYPVQNCNSSQLLQIDQLQIYTGQHPFYYKVSAAQNGREGLQFTQDRLKAGGWDLSETSKSSSVSAKQPDFVLAKDPLFSLLSDAPQELAQIEIGKGEPGIRGGAGGTKKRMAYLQQTRTPL